MGHVTRETDWWTIDVDTTSGQILLQERWQYTWALDPGQPAWTLDQKRRFHARADSAIWAAWSNRVRLKVTGSSAFARAHASGGCRLNLDIRWVTSRPHWQVTVTKVAAATFKQSFILWETRQISLDTNDFNTRTFGAGAAQTRQVPVAHEFGHTLGNVSSRSTGDEYRDTSPNVNDHASIMNEGNKLRPRHFALIVDELNQMIPDATFSVRSV